MPGFKLLTQLDSQTCLKAAWRCAQDLGYSVTPIEECSKRFTATKGSLIGNLLGGFLAPQCVFHVTVETYPDTNEVSIERNEPWLSSGKIGVSKVKRQAEELTNLIACTIEKAGGAISERKEY